MVIDIPEIDGRWVMMAISIDLFEVDGFPSFVGSQEDRCLEPFSFFGANGGPGVLPLDIDIAIGQTR